MHAGYLLSELLIALMFIVISTSSFTYYIYHMSTSQGDSLRECFALSVASEYLNSLIITRGTDIHDIQRTIEHCSLNAISTPVAHSIAFEGDGKYQRRYRCIEVTVTWKTIKGKTRTITLISGMIINEEKRI